MTSYKVDADHMRGGWQILACLSPNMAWHIATYRDKEIADEVADYLTAHSDMEQSRE